LYKVGDISFVRQAITPPGGNTVVQFPYRAMNDLNSYSVLQFSCEDEECKLWIDFAKSISTSKSWSSDWFSVARRSFLYGGDPRWDDVDRTLDFAAAVEASVVLEMDFSRRRFSQRSAKLITDDAQEQQEIVSLMKQLYDIRSSVIHGSKLSDKQREWLFENSRLIELRVRQVLVNAVQKVPANPDERIKVLRNLFDPSDADREAFVIQKFQELQSDASRKAVLDRLMEGNSQR
jgi:hypothetical protein